MVNDPEKNMDYSSISTLRYIANMGCREAQSAISPQGNNRSA